MDVFEQLNFAGPDSAACIKIDADTQGEEVPWRWIFPFWLCSTRLYAGLKEFSSQRQSNLPPL
ncbi:MAG: hypothetical protein NVV83_02420 [Afipia sp.]|nr:hypothetical protein [Afipia sp.]